MGTNARFAVKSVASRARAPLTFTSGCICNSIQFFKRRAFFDRFFLCRRICNLDHIGLIVVVAMTIPTGMINQF